MDPILEVTTSAIQSGSPIANIWGAADSDTAKIKCISPVFLRVQWLNSIIKHGLWIMAESFGCTPMVALT